jgi:hypothetical protein
MLQPFPARPFFRVLEAPIGLGAVVAGAASFVLALRSVGQGWLWIELLIMGPVMCGFGVLGLIHAFTGGLPEWVVGRDDDDQLGPDSPAA